MSERQKEALLAEVRDAVFRVCAIAGVLAGLYAGFEAKPAQPANCAKTDACVGETLVDAMMRILVPAGVGLLVGAVVGLFLAQLFRRRPRLERPSSSSPAAAMRWIRARYPGSCCACGSAVAPGDRVLWSKSAHAVTCSACATG